MNFTKTIKIAALCTLPLILTACGGDDGGSSSSNNEAWFKSAPTELEGTWVSGCEYDSYDQDYSITTETYHGNKLTQELDVYDDSICQVENNKLRITSQIKIGNTIGTEYTELDATLKKTEFLIPNQEYVTAANNLKMLGISNWTIDTYVNVSNNHEWLEGAEYGNGDPDFKVGAVSLEAFKIKNDKLYFGDDTQGLAHGRPVIIDYKYPANKK